MARLTEEQWTAARADYEIAGMGVSDIARKYGVAKSSVSAKSKAEKWKPNKTEQAKHDKTNAIIKLAEIEQQTEQTLSSTERTVFDVVVADEVAFKLQNDADMEAVRKHAMMLLPALERTSDVKALMETLRIQREARLGKAPDTAIQINNNAPERIERVIIDPTNAD